MIYFPDGLIKTWIRACCKTANLNDRCFANRFYSNKCHYIKGLIFKLALRMLSYFSINIIKHALHHEFGKIITISKSYLLGKLAFLEYLTIGLTFKFVH